MHYPREAHENQVKSKRRAMARSFHNHLILEHSFYFFRPWRFSTLRSSLRQGFWNVSCRVTTRLPRWGFS